MPPSTRTKQQRTSLPGEVRLYESKRPPRQVRFPARRRNVRDLKRDDEDGEWLKPDGEVEVDGAGHGFRAADGSEAKKNAMAQKGRKRRCDMMDEAENGGPTVNEVEDSRRKRRRSGVEPAISVKREPSRSVEVNEHVKQRARPPASTSGRPTATVSKRQSTLTQIVDGRVPLSGSTSASEEDAGGDHPDSKPAKRSARGSRRFGGRASRSQRTLTQMLPGLGRWVKDSDDEEGDDEDLRLDEQVDEEARRNHVYGEEMARRLASQGLLQEGHESPNENGCKDELLAKLQAISDEDKEYRPTQYIVAPTLNTRAPRRGSARKAKSETVDTVAPNASRISFAHLKTPEKRRVLEIPSSQSPADSPLSNQVTPMRSQRTPLQERSGNAVKLVGTPSKRPTRAFDQARKANMAQRRSLRRFESTIQDSEEDEDENEWPLAINRSRGSVAAGVAVGAETQAILQSIDLACSNTIGAVEEAEADDYEEALLPQSRSNNVQSLKPEKHSPTLRSLISGSSSLERADAAFHQLDALITHDTPGYVEIATMPLPSSPPPSHQSPLEESQLESQTQTRTTIHGMKDPNGSLDMLQPPLLAGTGESLPSTPMFIGDSDGDDDDQDEETTLTSPSFMKPVQMKSTSLKSTTSPAVTTIVKQEKASSFQPSHESETQGSHSSKAEQQLQAEWLSYSQYRTAASHGQLPASSIQVLPDQGHSYQATPRPPLPSQGTHVVQQDSHGDEAPSQATTLDLTQPPTQTRRQVDDNEALHHVSMEPTTSAVLVTTTPRKHSAQPIPTTPLTTSPIRPPPLFIPSSYPSPARMIMEGWSSPTFDRSSKDATATRDFAARHGCGQTGGEYGRYGSGFPSQSQSQIDEEGAASIEDFSIPSLPPGRVADGRADMFTREGFSDVEE